MEKLCNERFEADGTQLLDVPGEAHEQVGRVEVHGRYFEDMLARVLAQIRQAFGPSGWSAFTRPRKPQILSQEDVVTVTFQIAVGRDPELPGDLLQDLPNVISSSSVLHDDVAAHTARTRSNARLAVMQFNDHLATRRALDQRPRPLREFSVGDKVAGWRRGTGKRCPWQTAAGTMAWSWHHLGSSPRQLFLWPCRGASSRPLLKKSRHRTAEEQETDRVVLRCLRRTAHVFRELSVRQRTSRTSRSRIGLTETLKKTTVDGMELNQETPENLPSRRLVRKTPPPEVDEKHPDPQNEHVVQTPADAPSQPTVDLETTPFLPVLEPVSTLTQHSKTAEPRAKQPRIGERVYPSPLPMPIPSTPLTQHS